MSEQYAREILKRNVAQICQTIGWSGINSTPLDILVQVLEKYIRTIGTETNLFAEQFSRTEPNLEDLALAFRELRVQLPELIEYTACVPPIPPPVNIQTFPKPKESHLNFLKPGSHEVVTRPMHVHEHLPPMYPDKERDTPAVADTIEIRQNGMDMVGSTSATCISPDISVTDSPEKQKDIFKRPIDPVSLPNSKRPRFRLDEEERTREISSVMMTMSGFLSPAREGKLPEARSPITISDRVTDKHRTNSHLPNVMKAPPSHSSLEKGDKRSKKSKLLNGKITKSKRKDKSHKGESSKSREPSKLEKHSAGHVPRSKEAPAPAHLNHVTMPVPKVLPPPPVAKAMLQQPPVALDVVPTIKKEPIDPPPAPVRNSIPGEEAIPVPRKIPISKSPLVSNALPTPVHKQPLSHFTDVEIKKEVNAEEEKLASQPDRSKINIFKRISNKSKEDKTAPEAVPDKSQVDNLISHLENTPHEGPRTESKNHSSELIKLEELVVNNNDSGALDLSKQMDLTTNEVISIDDDSQDITAAPSRLIAEPCPNMVPVNKSVHLPYPKDMGMNSKVKKERKHKEKKDKAAEKAAKLEAKLLKKQQQILERQHLMGHKMPTQKPKLGKTKNDSSKMSHMSGFPFFPSMPPGRSLLPGPGLIPSPGLIPGGDFFAGLTNNPALRGLPPNLLANPFALNTTGPGLIPSHGFLGTGMPNPLMSMGNFVHPSRSQARSIPYRRPSLEVIPIDNDEGRGVHKSQLVSSIRDKDRHDKHKTSTIPNILQKEKSRIHKESHHKSNIFKMPPIQPDVTIELNPPKVEPVKLEPVSEPPPPPVARFPTPEPLPEPRPEPVPADTSSTVIPKEKEEKCERKKDKKKEKKDKDGMKIKKKKDKKDKNKDKTEKKKVKEEKHDIKDKIKKEKKEKKKEKIVEGLVPKLTLKLGSASPMPPSSPDIFKLNIKPIVKKEEDEEGSAVNTEPVSREHSNSPELAQISALVTRPPKQKHISKHNHVAEQSEPKSPPQTSASPTRKNRPPSSHNKYKRILVKPISKKSHLEHYDDSDMSAITDEPAQKPAEKTLPNPLPTPYYVDDLGNKIWVCPACEKPDNGSPMIGCDGCDGWYHWVCVGITEEPGASEDWFCRSCLAKRAAMVTALAGVTTGKKRGRKPKMDKIRDIH